MKKRTGLISAAAVLSLSALLAGCSGATASDAASTAKHSAIPNGGTIVQTVSSSLGVNFIPLLDSSEYNQNVTSSMFDSILTVNPQNQLMGDLANMPTVSKNGLTYTFTLKPSAKWSNGQRITSKDVELGVDWLASKTYNNPPDDGSYGSFVQAIVGGSNPLPDGKTPSGFKTLGAYKFSITVQKADPTELGSNLAFITPLPSSVLGKIPMSKWMTSSFNKKPTVGSGAYVIQSIVPNQSVTMKANPYYVFGEPHITNSIIKVISPDVVVGDLVSGQVTMATVHAQDFIKLKNNPSLAENSEPANGYDFLGWRQNNVTYGKEFRNVKFRQAVEYAINRVALGDALDKGYFTVTNGPFPEGVSYFDKTLSNAYAYNPEKANELLNEAGFLINKKTGFRMTPGGRPFNPTLTYASGDSNTQEMAQFVKQFLGAVHINLKLLPPINFQQQINEMNNDSNGKQPIEGFLEGWDLGSGPQDPRPLWLSTAPFNTTVQDWETPASVLKENDTLLAEQASLKAYNPVYRQNILNQWQVLWNSQEPTNQLIADNSLTVYSKNLHGVVFSSLGDFYPWKWYLTPSN
ncbi:MAG: ABC transporter substrate-binding protein [Firmicutes bacterium]|nr:ABC transporter substrate-binding protein [Bacillota bacterium]